MNWVGLITNLFFGFCAGYLLAQNIRLRRENKELVDALSESNDVMERAAKTIDALIKERDGE